MYILIYPPEGKQKVGNVETVDKLEEMVYDQVAAGYVKVLSVGIHSAMVQELAYLGHDHFIWVVPKALKLKVKESDKGDI